MTSGVFPGVADQAVGSPIVQLVLFSDDQLGPQDASGVVKPTFQNVLAWRILFRDVQYVPPAGPHRVDASYAPYPEDVVIVVDATSGKMLTAFAGVPQ